MLPGGRGVVHVGADGLIGCGMRRSRGVLEKDSIGDT